MSGVEVGTCQKRSMLSNLYSKSFEIQNFFDFFACQNIAKIRKLMGVYSKGMV